MSPRSKYGAIRTTIDGITFASKREAARYAELKMLEKAGKIMALALQPKFPLIVAGCHAGERAKVGTYTADFSYIDHEGDPVIEDVKGVKTTVYRLKKKMVEAIYGITITEVT